MKTGKLFFIVFVLTIVLSMITGCQTQTKNEKTLSPELAMMYKDQNGFVNNLYVLHKKRLEGREFYTTEEVGGYGGLTNDLNFYNKESFYDSKSKRLLSSIKWEKDNPDNIHMIDLFVHDKQGRLKRKYSATYLPSRRVSPFETSITLHYYSNGYHSFREFDVFNALYYEQCSDIMDKRKTYFALHYEDIPDSYQELDVEKHEIYRACFEHASSTAEPYISPLNELAEIITDP
ncbi:MAG: hypothetical protein ACN4GR_04845 [Arenicellales bacterium]